jgi:hypothetical protein
MCRSVSLWLIKREALVIGVDIKGNLTSRRKSSTMAPSAITAEAGFQSIPSKADVQELVNIQQQEHAGAGEEQESQLSTLCLGPNPLTGIPKFVSF